MRCIDSLRVTIMISEDREDRSTRKIRFQKVVKNPFRIGGIVSRELVLAIVGYQIASIDSPCEMVAWVRARTYDVGERRNRLQSSSYQEVW